MFGRPSLAALCRGLCALAAVACLAAPAAAAPSPGYGPPGDSLYAAARSRDVVFPLYALRPEAGPVYLLRRDAGRVEVVWPRGDAMPVGRLRSFAARFAPWRGAPWSSAAVEAPPRPD